MNDWQDLIGKITCADCLDILKQLPDKCIDLLLTDPPYGIGVGETKEHNGWNAFGKQEWDKERPSAEIFREMLRVSKNQIIWGGNYFADLLPASQGWFVWNKMQRNFSLADGELAWTSFDKALRIFDYSRGQANQDEKIHPTQKPLKLIEWCLARGGGWKMTLSLIVSAVQEQQPLPAITLNAGLSVLKKTRNTGKPVAKD